MTNWPWDAARVINSRLHALGQSGPPAAGNRMPGQLQYADDNENISSPISIEQIWALADEGTIHADTLVWQEGMEMWTR